MQRLSIYQYHDYKRYLMDWMERAPHKGRGQRKLLAEAVGCQTPFITHVLSGEYQFSLEQAEAATRWLGLGEAEAEYFVLLVIRQRAATRGLESMANRQLSRRRESEAVLKKRLNLEGRLSFEDQVKYYSNWQYSVVHMACHIPQLQNVEAMTATFGFTVNETIDALGFLTDLKLIEKTKTGYRVLRPMMHLGKESPLLPQYHTQWRLRAAESYQRRQPGNLSYSGVMSLSRDDYEWAREKLSQTLEEIVARIKDSKDETVAVLCFDLFRF